MSDFRLDADYRDFLISLWHSPFMEQKAENQYTLTNGTVVHLIQDAYVSDCGTQYQASAEDMEGNVYVVRWDVICADEDLDDESNACNWNKPKSICADGENRDLL